MLQVMWKVLSAPGKPAWQISQPIPLIKSGTVAAVQLAVSSNATLTVALQTVEQANKVHIIGVKGNPMVPIGPEGSSPRVPIGSEGTLSVQCQPMGSLDLHKGESIVQFLFEPQSAGGVMSATA